MINPASFIFQSVFQTLFPAKKKENATPKKLRMNRSSSAENCPRKIFTIGTVKGPVNHTVTIAKSPIFTDRAVLELVFM